MVHKHFSPYFIGYVFFFFLVYNLRHAASWLLRDQAVSPAVEAWNFNPWTIREVPCLFLLFVVSLLCIQFLVWWSTCLFLLSLSVLLVSHPRNHCQDQCHEAFSLFFLGVLQFQVLFFMYLIYFELIFVYDVRSVQFSSFVYDYP